MTWKTRDFTLTDAITQKSTLSGMKFDYPGVPPKVKKNEK